MVLRDKTDLTLGNETDILLGEKTGMVLIILLFSMITMWFMLSTITSALVFWSLLHSMPSYSLRTPTGKDTETGSHTWSDFSSGSGYGTNLALGYAP